MPMFDYNNPTNTELGKAYDYDGTTSHQLGKGYDWDGTTSRLVYSAETPIVENSTGLYTPTKVNEWYIVNNAKVTATKQSLSITAGSGNSSGSLYYFPLDIKGMKTLKVKASKTATQVANLKRNNTIIAVGTLTQLKSMVLCDSAFTAGSAKILWNNDEQSATVDKSYDISSYTGSTCYVAMGVMGYYGSTTTINIETLTVAD